MTRTHDRMTKFVPIEQLVPYPRNARNHPPAQIEALKAALSKFGLVSPLTVQASTSYVLGGNGRLEAARALGWKVIECKIVELTDAEALLVNAGLNQLDRMATDNEKILAENLLEGLSQLSVDPIAIGFDQGDLDRLSAALDEGTREAPDKISVSAHERDRLEHNEPDEDLAVASIAKRGDVWLMGAHKLYVGAITDTAFAELQSTWQTDTVWAYTGDVVSEEELAAVSLIAADYIFLSIDHDVYNQTTQLTERKPDAHIIWDQGTRSPQGVGYVSRHRLVLFYGRLARAGLCDVWQISRDAKADHLPIALPAKAFSDVAARRALDPFARKGSSLLAAEQLGVQMLCAEGEPAEADYIIARWERLTGKKAAKANMKGKKK